MTKFTIIKNQVEFENLCKTDVLYSLSAAYPETGAITCNDVLALERAGSEPEDKRAQTIKQVFATINKRAEDIKLNDLQEKQKKTPTSNEGHKSHANVQQLKVLY